MHWYKANYQKLNDTVTAKRPLLSGLARVNINICLTEDSSIPCI